MKKILIIRFSSIGDIVLTSPIVRCLNLQTKAKIHYLTKYKYLDLVQYNPHIEKVYTFNDNDFKILNLLKLENYDLIIDLHNNFKSFYIKRYLNIKTYTTKKHIFKKFLLLYCGINLFKNHVVDRYFETLFKMNIFKDKLGLDYFFNPGTSVNFNTNQKYLAWCIGASYIQKQVSEKQIIEVCNNLSVPIVLLGGLKERDMGTRILQSCNDAQIYNFCGHASFSESAFLIKKSFLVLTNDTGLMHIAASYKKNIISFWGCTKPVWGFYPYLPGDKSCQIIINPESPPCSKHGEYCKIDDQGCIKQIKVTDILEKVKSLI